MRRPRIHGDPWDGEPPLVEARERYAIGVLNPSAVGNYVVDAPRFEVELPDMDAAPYLLRAQVQQWSDLWGFGLVTRRDLWL